MDLATALDYYQQHRCVVFWNPRDITEENLTTDIPDAETLLVYRADISTSEVHEGQYLVQDGKLQTYHPYPGHDGIAQVFEAIKQLGPDFDSMAVAAIKQCVEMGWKIMEAAPDGEERFFDRWSQS